MKRFEGRVAVVTGAGSRGMGTEVARLLAAEGAKVVANGHSKNENGEYKVDKIVDEIRAAGGEATAAHFDISVFANNAALIQQTIDTYGKIDILCCVAGVINYSPLMALSEEDFDKSINVNAKSVFGLTKAAYPYMNEQKYGRIVVFASSAAFGLAGSISYSASKGASLSFTEALGYELIPQCNNVKINCVLPSAVTGMFPMDRVCWGGLPKPDPAGPDMTAPLAAYLSSEECVSNGEIYYAGGPDVAVHTRERPTVGLIRKGNGEKWTVDELDVMIPETFGWYFNQKVVFYLDENGVPAMKPAPEFKVK